MPIQFGIEYKVHNKPAYSLHAGLDEWMKANAVGLISICTIEFNKEFVDFYITREKSNNSIDTSMRIVYVNGYNLPVLANPPRAMLGSFSEAQQNIILQVIFGIVRHVRD